jgi:hypothetical protein
MRPGGRRGPTHERQRSPGGKRHAQQPQHPADPDRLVHDQDRTEGGYHFLKAGHVTYFTHPGWPKALYLFILGTHTPLAIVALPLIILTVIPAIRRRFEAHKRMARWTLPVWLYVSVTGVLVYFMLYVWFPSAKI